MSDWDASDHETAPAPASAAPIAKKPIKNKWADEDQESDGPVSDWEESSEDEKPSPAPVPAAPPKKKGTIKAKIAEKEAAKAAARDVADDDDYDEDAVLDPRSKAQADRERELAADLKNAAELLGSAAIGGTSDKELDKLVSANPRTKEDFIALSSSIIEYLIKRHQDKPLYAAFVEHHVRELALPLRDVEVRKAASGLTTLANEKQKQQREATSGKKKPKAATKPVLGAVKTANKYDTEVYDEALDDFGTNPDDFM
ncbi:eukaryotic translation initiation factor 3 subunit J [Amylostereum chailletii]|nr:eukaryotic translation initiation factor 3 subunit J [Amylostereum chailletii]